MIRHIVLAAAAVGLLAAAGIAKAADLQRKAPAAAPAVVEVEDCSAFYNDYQVRGFTWGSGPGVGLGFGTFEGALPRYPANEFPNWYGWCKTWGHYSASGTARHGVGGGAIW